MLLMVNDASSVRKIYYAHSQDGKTWTKIAKPLLTPDSSKAPPGTNYGGSMGNNLSGPFLHIIDGRYCITAHASSRNVYFFEVGQSLDKEIHWGIVYDSTEGFPDYGRASAPYFIMGDNGLWHMYYEGGPHLHANIVHAVQILQFQHN